MSFKRNLLIIFLTISANFLAANLCFSKPSDLMIKKLTRNAVDFRKNNLPTILNEVTRKASFGKVINRTLTDISHEKYQDFETDRTILSCFLTDCTNCDSLVENLTINLLFSGNEVNPGWFSDIELSNPSYQEAKILYPDFSLRHDTTIKGLEKILERGIIGFALSEKFPEFETAEGNLAKDYSFPLKGYHGTFVEWAPSQQVADSIPFYRGSGVRLIVKKELLNRWDFHISDAHIRAEFHDKIEGDHYSFGPAQFKEFAQHYQQKVGTPSAINRNELIFYNPICLDDIEEIIVPSVGFEKTKELLKHFNREIRIRIDDSTPENIRAWSEYFQQTSDDFYDNYQKYLKPIANLKRDIELMVHEHREDFESFDSEKQRTTFEMLWNSRYVMSERAICYQEKKEFLNLLVVQHVDRKTFEMFFETICPKENGKFLEPWMQHEAEFWYSKLAS